MDLATVKAAVKKWEKSFRMREGRDPTKEDIKKDPGDIATQYSLYRKLMKASSQAQSKSQKISSQSLHPPSSSTVTAPSSSSSSQYRSTPRNIPTSEYPTTPTPPARRNYESFFANSQAGPSRSSSIDTSKVNGKDATGNGKVDDGKSLKRKASKATFSSSSPPHPPPQSYSIHQSSSSSSTSTSRTLFNTPKKKGYVGPIHDPNPINPFTITSPSKSPFPPSFTSTAGLQREKSFSSPFIHASSPKKLKEVLEANSLKKVKERTDINGRNGNGLMEITPRTRARKRLKGEQVEDTPLKDKLPKKRRGYGSGRSEGPMDHDLQNHQNQSRQDISNRSKFDNKGIFDEEHFEDDDEEEEDELGPSPMKSLNGKGRGFTSLFGEQEPLSDEDDIPFAFDKGGLPQKNDLGGKSKVQAAADQRKSKVKEVKKGKQSEMMMNFFGRTGKSTLPTKKQDIEGSAHGQSASKSTSSTPTPDIPSIQIHHSPPPLLEPTPSTEDIPLLEESIIPAPPPEGLPISPEHTPSASQQRREKILNLSDDEIDEWDPEGGHVKREIRIVPTRRAVRRRDSSDLSDGDQGADQDNEDGDEDEDEEDEDEEDEDEVAGRDPANPIDQTAIISNEDPLSPNSATSSMLNLLSIQSPSRAKSKARLNKAKLDELKVKAIFNPIEATKLKAIKRGQDISFTGETRYIDDDELEENDLLENFNLTSTAGRNHGDDALRLDDGGEGEAQELEDDDWESESDGWKREQLEEDW